MARLPDQRHRLLHRLLIQIGERIVDRPGEIERKALLHLLETGRRFRDLPVQRTFRIKQFHRNAVLQTGETIVTKLLAEPHHLCAVAMAALGKLAHFCLKHLLRIVDDSFCYYPVVSAQFHEPLTDFQ